MRFAFVRGPGVFAKGACGSAHCRVVRSLARPHVREAQPRRLDPVRMCAGAATSGNEFRLDRLREVLRKEKVDAFIVPSPDPHNSEYASDCFNRRSYISNFDGSAGTAVITPDEALLWTDGRYFLQAEQQLSSSWTLMRAGSQGVPTVEKWLAENVSKEGKVAIDPLVHSISSQKTLRDELSKKGIELVYLDNNPVDAVWEDRPPLPEAAVRVHPIEYAGRSVPEKLGDVRSSLAENNADAILLSMLDEVAWMLNVRGDDIPCCPVVLSYLLVEKEGKATLFVDERKIGPEVRSHLEEAGVATAPYQDAKQAVVELAEGDAKIWLHPASTSAAMFDAANRKSNALTTPTPVPLMKALKNEQEMAAMQNAHAKDGAALSNFLCWLEQTVADGTRLTEVEAAEKLEGFRREQPGFLDVSFPTIAGSGANGAIIHYRATPESCGDVSADKLFLLDSGGQYVDGTTDVTRTFHLGNPDAKQIECFTRVLKGHIAIDSAVYPEGTTGSMIDSLARLPLWEAGLDFRHGTGHGVGACLNVHEGPHSISPRPNTTALAAGMIVSNEPGYYEDGSFGIRIENLLMVKGVETPYKFADKKYLGFGRLTHVPIQKKMIDFDLLTEREKSWLDNYHSEVWDLISPRVEGDTLEWLRKSTEPISTAAASGDSKTTTRREVLASIGGLGALLLPWKEGKAEMESERTTSASDLTITDKCFMDISIDGNSAGRIVFGLYGKATPKTVENFVALCRGDPGFGYKGSEIYRVVQGLTVQGGDVTGKKGNGGRSIYGESFPPENFDVGHYEMGTISMVKNRQNQNDSRFFVTTRDDSGYLDGKYVAFGRVVEGLDVLRQVESVKSSPPTNKPSKPIYISDCGAL